MTHRSIHWLRLMALTEAVSFLVLLGLAMPLKYLADQPLAVEWVGWVHGVLFMAFSVLLAWVFIRHQWSVKRTALVFVAALVPFGPFVIDGRLRAFESE